MSQKGEPQRCWTALERGRLVEWRRLGVPVGEIARRLGRTKRAVQGAAFRFNLTPRTPRVDRDQVIRLHAELHPNAEIARRLGCSVLTVAWILATVGKRANGDNAASRRRRAKAIRERREEEGSWHHLPHRRRAAAAGWPEASGAAQAAVLQAIREKGPCRREVVMEATGLKLRACQYHLRKLKRIGQIVVLSGRRYDLADWLRRRKEFSDV